MINLKYSLIIEATEEPDFFVYYSPDLEGFTGVGKTIEDCISSSEVAMEEHISLLKQQALPIPPINPKPIVIVQNSERIVPAA